MCIVNASRKCGPTEYLSARVARGGPQEEATTLPQQSPTVFTINADYNSERADDYVGRSAGAGGSNGGGCSSGRRNGSGGCCISSGGRGGGGSGCGGCGGGCDRGRGDDRGGNRGSDRGTCCELTHIHTSALQLDKRACQAAGIHAAFV